jgi:hypothetical protein
LREDERALGESAQSEDAEDGRNAVVFVVDDEEEKRKRDDQR